MSPQTWKGFCFVLVCSIEPYVLRCIHACCRVQLPVSSLRETRVASYRYFGVANF